jgi:hypothetical protein
MKTTKKRARIAQSVVQIAPDASEGGTGLKLSLKMGRYVDFRMSMYR